MPGKGVCILRRGNVRMTLRVRDTFQRPSSTVKRWDSCLPGTQIKNKQFFKWMEMVI